MSDNTTEKQPTTDQELARDVDRRLDAAENTVSVRAGAWVISTEDSSGNLVAHHDNGSGVKLADKPPDGADPDVLTEPPPPKQIPEHKTARFKVKGGPRSVSSGSIIVFNTWNTTPDYAEPSGAWNNTSTGVTIPEDGDYLFVVYMPWTSVAGGERSLEFRRNGQIIDIDTKMSPDPGRVVNLHVTQTLRCAAQDTIDVRVYQDNPGGLSVSCGGANFGDAWAQMSITRIADADYPQHAEDGSPWKGTDTTTVAT